MIPEKVCFTGLELDPRAVMRGRVEQGVIPSGWTRLRFDGVTVTPRNLDRWIARHMDGRWASYAYTMSGRNYTVIAFESETDAVMFQLRDGITASAREEDVEVF